jgi:hypothetical protein
MSLERFRVQEVKEVLHLITQEQLTDVEKLRKDVLALVAKGVTDEYLLATYNGITRRLDERLPNIRKRVEGNTLKQESRTIVKQQREAMKHKTGAAGSRPPSSTQKSA